MDTSAENIPCRYVVGIDLGTTNSAVCYVDTEESPWRVRLLPIPQTVAPGQVEPRDTLPSFHYQPAEGEFAPDALRLPWQSKASGDTVGHFARDHGTAVPGRLIASTKSWLCHAAVDRTAALLPWHGAPDVDRLSPVEVSARYLAHVAAAWNAKFPFAPLAGQDVVLTLPASFDEIARELTVKAAAAAGLPRVVLIEEPQAAFYAWIYKHADDWEQRVSPGQKILVCDVGGGTSDFTLIRVRKGEDGKAKFHRVSVGDHLILGGDNQDLALAHHIERRLMGDGKLEARQWAFLVRSCRNVKETLLAEQPPEQFTLTIPGTGSKLIGGGQQVELARDEVQQLLVEGFFPACDLDDKPETRRSGFQEFGLPYAPDAAITRYLAAFLTAHRHVAEDPDAESTTHDSARPDVVLFNGGVFASPLLRIRLIETISRWFSKPGQPWTPVLLDNDRLDLAVARGAAYYGMVRRGEGVRISAGLARTYYLGLESEPPTAICLAPAGLEPGAEIELVNRQFSLLVSQPAEFPLFVSSTRLTDRSGEVVPVDREQMTALPPIRTVLHAGRSKETGTANVHLHAKLTEIGTLELWCSEVAGRRNWKLQFDVRSTTQTDLEAHTPIAEQQGFLDEETWDRCRREIEQTFGPGGEHGPEGLARRLTEALGMHRREWPPSLLRRMWETLLEFEPARQRSAVHEARWLNLLGFSLRPGYGLAADDWRIAETRRALKGRLAHGTPACLSEWWIFWRRISGGLSARQQQALADPLLLSIRQAHKSRASGKSRGGDFNLLSHESSEIWRLLGSLELLDARTRSNLGEILLDLVGRKKSEPVRPALFWTLGRLGARVPLYGPLNTVVSKETVGHWLQKLMETESASGPPPLTIMQLARRTDDRHRDLSAATREDIVRWLEQQQAPAHFIELVRDGGRLDEEEQGLVFGEALPKGLRLG